MKKAVALVAGVLLLVAPVTAGAAERAKNAGHVMSTEDAREVLRKAGISTVSTDLDPTMTGVATGVGTTGGAQGIGVWACVVAGISVLSPPPAIALLTTIESCTMNGREAVITPITCPGSVCGFVGTNFIDDVSAVCWQASGVFYDPINLRVLNASGDGCGAAVGIPLG